MSTDQQASRPGGLQCVWVPGADGKLESYWVADTLEAAAEIVTLTNEFHRIAASVEPGYAHAGTRRAG